MVQTIGLILAGFWTGWGVLIVRDDLKIRKEHRWRRFRASFLAFLLALFMLSLGARGLDKLGVFVSSAVLAIGVMVRKKRVMPRRKRRKKR